MKEFFQHIPTWQGILQFSPPLLLFIILAGWISGALKVHHQLKTNYTRKFFHFLIFSLAGVLHWQFGLEMVNLLGAVIGLYLAVVLILGNGNLFYEALAREQDAPHRSFYVIISYFATAAGGILSNIFFHHYAVVGYLVAGWGDAAGEPIGARFGKHHFRVPTLGEVVCYRSAEGSLAVFVVSTLAAFIALYQFLDQPFTIASTTAFVTGLIASIVEAFSFHGLDNLTIQLVASGVAFFSITNFF
jgi:phytol kinase